MPEYHKLSEYHRGWLIGDFEPSLRRMRSFEACIAAHRKGEITQAHYHTQSEEINLVLDGQLKVNGKILEKGDIFVYHKNEISDVEFLEDTDLLVIRIPSAPNDKVIL